MVESSKRPEGCNFSLQGVSAVMQMVMGARAEVTRGRSEGGHLLLVVGAQ